eukprot:CAMPEP_0197599428 /NCGR_PEP_ID=MMETSP1326-20131121/31364_1 /TAXON_ID=1155430 /ORGANISM="Genus nov. species nov., Strain RCC2288" /LENGTH=100 /DNA_ID=CAMNT_0043166397 /DNA_START=207 /DNA_END=505 /DNA_ORIENTATION=+
MSGADDPYDVLGIANNASADDVRKAYRKNAIRWHPDKNPENQAAAEVMFKKVAAAYEVLSDEDKRAAYDRYGGPGVEGMQGGASAGGGGNWGAAGGGRGG